VRLPWLLLFACQPGKYNSQASRFVINRVPLKKKSVAQTGEDEKVASPVKYRTKIH
jgi:hypothetical protein